MGFIKRQKYKIFIFFEKWMDRKIVETENRDLTLLESLMLIFGYCVWKVVNPYTWVI